MAKDGKKKGKTIPKHIGGVKLPKELRRQGEALIAKANSPEGRAAIAKGLTMAAAVATAAAAKSQARAAVDAARSDGTQAAGAAPLDGEAIAQAVSNVADAVLGRLFGAKKA